jgi:F-type H+-transporting ATPase subunit gamma
MANMRAIRTRIKSVKNTEQITKAMKMVAVSKLRRTQSGMQAMRPFSEKSQEVMDTLLSSSSVPENRFIKPHKEVKKVCYVLFLGNRGLCGAYNSSILHYANSVIKQSGKDYGLVVCGRWGKDVLANSSLKVVKTFSELSDTPNIDEALEVADYLKSLYTSGEYDEVHLIYQHYVTALRQDPMNVQYLPAVPEKSEHKKGPGRIFIFEPDTDSVLESVMQLYLNNKIMSVLLDSKCGEHSARMTAMTAASDSTKTLIAQLDLKLNRARQAAITTEITEIVGGAAALKKKKQ